MKKTLPREHVGNIIGMANNVILYDRKIVEILRLGKIIDSKKYYAC